ncbi:Maltose/maltodextrin import ATP-binding protein MalK [Planctomycetes bacterium Poly30]|uniref:Maltose/maltodextrin import ATP-binding protein MalK n=1 Tax=Saltatorellus ferox TaxID=2528018 RepID=A0A518ESM0_9BACT|nr:Maltose/maltodextrin import ATP-binding protein MalK [Planctomycetes bacterium Poly30]
MSSSPPPPAVECKGLIVRAGKAEILSDISLRIEPEEHVLLVGPSGAGKSTLLRAIAGLAVPSKGEIHLFGELASRPGELVLAPDKRGVGFLFQGGALWPHMSVAGTLDFVLKRKGQDRSARKRRIAELLEIVDLAGYDKRRTPTLSGGEAQRLGLARALATEPKILALDEPLGPLDAPRREALLDQLQSLARRFGLTTIHVTHDPDEAARVATRTITMTEEGALV